MKADNVNAAPPRDGVLGQVFRLAQWISAITETGLNYADRIMQPWWAQSLGWVLLLAGLAIYSLIQPFDLSRLMTGDALYPVHMLHFPFLDFRPPPSNNLFPDVIVHAILNPFIPDPLTQKLVAGWTLLAGMVIAIGVFSGPLAALVIMALLSLTGFGAIDTTSHYTLPLCVLLYELARRSRWAQGLVLFASVFSDLLFLLPASLLVLRRGEENRLTERVIICFLAGVLNILHSEFSRVLPGIAVAVIVFWAAALAARVFRLERVMAVAVTLALAAMSVGGVEAIRYAVPVAASFALLLFVSRQPSFDWRPVAALVIAFEIFAFTVNPTHLNLLNSQYDCLLKVLKARNITVIAADHWTAKPLYFAALQRNQNLTITQMDFVKDMNDYWMAPYENSGQPTRFSFRSNTVCADIWKLVAAPQLNCSQDTVAPVISREPICNGLELFEYDRNVPDTYIPRPTNKLQSIVNNLTEYFSRS